MKIYKSPLPEITLKYKSGQQNKVKITNSRESATLLRVLFDADTIELQEEFIIILLNRAKNTLGWMKISRGGMTATIVEPAFVFTAALQSCASSIILAHNHPSGNLSPSRADVGLTRRMVEAGKLLGIDVIDHIIMSGDGENYTSMAEEGYIY